MGAALAGLLAAEELVVEHREASERALSRFRTGASDFSDYLIGEIALEAGAELTLSFDRKACRSELFERA